MTRLVASIALSAALVAPLAPAHAERATVDLSLGDVQLTLLMQRVDLPPEHRAAAFVQRLMQDWSRPGRDGARRLAGYYDASVEYYGDRYRHAQVLDDRYAFAERWPQRRYDIDPDSVDVSCFDTCYVFATYTFTAQNPSTGAYSAGRSTLELVLVADGDGFVITAENGHVTARY
ncbi:MAG: hypothetical protein KDK12_18285 [Rhodobacteraceae bacterium]|nr:hypothetical protein [Paracoccaceae bacterium]